MEITGIRNYDNNSICENNCTSKSNETNKTSTKEKTNMTAKDKLSYLSEKYECLKSPNYSVNINRSLLEKATSDKKTSEWLEYNLSLIPKAVDGIKSAVEASGAKLLSCNVKINGYDSITTEVMTQVEVDSGTEKARKELKEKIEAIREKKKTEKNEWKKKAEKKETKKHTISVTDKNIKAVTQKVITTPLNPSIVARKSFVDIKA